MTAEICLINKMGVALAADSAVTIGGGNKIYNSANKLFALSKYQPVGIMVYGNASFLRVPWETIIKLFREQLGNTIFDQLSDYNDEFINFLENNEFDELMTVKEEENYNLTIIEESIINIYHNIMKDLKEYIDDSPQLNEEELKELVKDLFKVKIGSKLDEINNEEYIDDLDENDLRYISDIYDTHITHIVDKYFENFIFYDEQVEEISQIVKQKLLKEFSSHTSGIVIAGFGKKNLYPVVIAQEIDGKIDSKIKTAVTTHTSIGENADSGIYPFAQSEMVYSFLEGIDPDMESLSDYYLTQIFNETSDIFVDQMESILIPEVQIDVLKSTIKGEMVKIYERYKATIKSYQEREFTDPTLGILRSLPKGELAEMAEALVNLTSFRRKASGSLETVGGPIDVAVITKGDGFVWIKRKHYFEPDRNQHFYTNYFKRED